MRDADPAFPVARCAPCEREVLLHHALDPDGEERMRCVGCDAEIDPREVRWVPELGLAELGYSLDGEVGTSGCGRPGCGGGRCGRPAAPETSR